MLQSVARARCGYRRFRPPARWEKVMAGRVYVIEDDDAIRSLIVDALRDEGHEVDCATNGAEAMAHLQASGDAQPDVILLDLFLPVLHGRDFATAYRQLPVPHAPIVAITAARDADARAAELNADGLVVKPFAIGDLVHQVERHLHSAAAR
jgi:CheY-like chemotaxis protein